MSNLTHSIEHRLPHASAPLLQPTPSTPRPFKNFSATEPYRQLPSRGKLMGSLGLLLSCHELNTSDGQPGFIVWPLDASPGPTQTVQIIL